MSISDDGVGIFHKIQRAFGLDDPREGIFEKFAGEDEDFGFVRTQIPILLADYGADGLMSRSKAKRVMSGVGKFKEVVLDFSGVERIGQAFADEIFRVYANSHPAVNIQYMNAVPAVERLIRRALANKKDG
ncbi:MAG: STAS-like domain-containing protein [Bacteroidetes bacterium]|nr:STAS-like domain-containing protein [Bacteroidota bacterium]